MDDSSAADANQDSVFDGNGVDCFQIRQLLDLEPEERLRRLQSFMDAVDNIRYLNGVRPL